MPHIYDPKFTASLLEKPIEIDKEIKSMLGVTPDGTERVGRYSQSDKFSIAQERGRIYREITKGVSVRPANVQGTAFNTAGSPGGGKSVMIRKMLAEGLLSPYAVYNHPDDQALKRMKMYKNGVARVGESDIGRLAVYVQSRWASQNITNSNINREAQEGYDPVIDTTGTGGATNATYENVRAIGFKNHTFLVNAPEEVRIESIERRFEETRQFILMRDVVEKGNVLFPKTAIWHFEQPDILDVFWRSDVNKAPVLAAQGRDGDFTIVDQSAFTDFTKELTDRNPQFSMDQAIESFVARGKMGGSVPPPPSSRGSALRL